MMGGADAADAVRMAREHIEGCAEIALALLESPSQCDKALHVLYAATSFAGDSLYHAEEVMADAERRNGRAMRYNRNICK